MSILNNLGWLTLIIIIITCFLWLIPSLFFWSASQLFGYTIVNSFINIVAFWVFTNIVAITMHPPGRKGVINDAVTNLRKSKR